MLKINLDFLLIIFISSIPCPTYSSTATVHFSFLTPLRSQLELHFFFNSCFSCVCELAMIDGKTFRSKIKITAREHTARVMQDSVPCHRQSARQINYRRDSIFLTGKQVKRVNPNPHQL
jgi:hypothetical protein